MTDAQQRRRLVNATKMTAKRLFVNRAKTVVVIDGLTAATKENVVLAVIDPVCRQIDRIIVEIISHQQRKMNA